MSITPSKYIKENRKKSTFNFKQSLTDRIGADTFNTDIEQFNKDYSADYLSNWHSAEDINTYYDRLSSLNDRTKAYQSYVNLYGTDEQKSVLGDIGKQISAYGEMIGKRQDVLDYYANFDNAESYNAAVEEAKRQEIEDENFYNSYDVEGARKRLEALSKNFKSPIQDPVGYIADFGQYYGNLENEMKDLESNIERWENIEKGKYYSQYTQEAEYNPAYSKHGNLYESVYMGAKSGPMKTYGDVFKEAKNKYKYQYMTKDEKKKFYALWENEGEKAAAEYIDYLTPYLYSRSQENRSEKTKDDLFWTSVGTAIEDVFLVPIEQLNRYVEYGVTGKSEFNLTAQEVELAQGAVKDDMSGFGSFLYSTTVSGATSVAASAISSVAGGPVGEVLLGLSAAAHAQNDVLSRGGNSNQAVVGGIAAGAFEALFEHLSISKLIDSKPKNWVKAFSDKDWEKALKDAVGEFAESMGVNASEEMLTEIANIAFDMVNTGELSNAAIQYNELIESGVPKEQAFWKTVGSNIAQVLEAGASGALMGAGFSAIGGGVGLAKVDKARRKLGKSNISGGKTATLIEEATEYFKGEEYKKQQALIQKVEKGLADNKQGRSQQRNIGKLIEAYVEANYKEQNRELAEDSVNNIEKTKKTIENEATKTKVDNTNPTITNDNLPKILGFKEGKLSETVIETENGATAFTEESAANADIGTLYACAIRLGNTQSANNFVQNWGGKTDPFQYYLDFLKFQMRGTYAPDSYDKTMTDYAGVKMSPAAKHAAFQSGISLRESTKEKITKQSEALKGEYEKLGGKAKKGKFNDSKLNYSALTKEQKDVVNFTRILSDYLGVNVEFFVSQKGKRGANGYYKAKNNTIYLDIYAGIGNKESYSAIKDCLINTMSHEIVHNMKVTAPTEYAALRDFIIDKLSKQEGYDLDAKIEQIIAENSDQGFTVEDAIEEIVAMSCEDLLGSSEKLQTTLTEFYAQNEKAANSFTKYVREVLNRLKAFFEKIIGKKSIAEESQLMAKQSAEFISELQKRYDAALLAMREGNAVRNTLGNLTATEQVTLAENGIAVDESTGDVHKVRNSVRYSTANKDAQGNIIDLVTVGKKSFNTEAIAKLVATATGRSIEDARKWVHSEITIANLVMDNPEFLDFEPDDRYQGIKKNSDYPQGTVDLSNLCPKREEFTTMFDLLQKKYPDKLFTAADVASMREILKNHGITVACGACFVEDRRQLLGEIADTYINMWKEAVENGTPLQKTNAEGKKIKLQVTAALAKQYGLTKGADIMATDKYIPTQYDLTTYEGFKLLEKNHPLVAMGFNRYNNSRGQQAGRLIEGRAEYDRQILGWAPNKVKTVNNNGGLRIFSFSDFEVVHLLDLVQVIIDCAAMGVKIQGYTKIPAFARLVRNTGIKLNRSLIPKGETGIKIVNGKEALDIDLVEGIDIEDENFLDESDNDNVGNIIIGINPKQIGIAMLDDFIDYIIPFHTNKSKDICRKLGVGEWNNYKESQHEKDIETGKASKHNVNIYTQVINKYHPTNKTEFVDAFLKECRSQKKVPRYSEFLYKEYKSDGAYSDEGGRFDYTYREGYHKLLVDFKMFDKEGNILPQGDIVPELDDAFMAELLDKEIARKKDYTFPQEVYDEIDRVFGDGDKVMKQARENTSNYLEYDKPITLKDIELLRSIGRKSINEFTSEDIEKAQKWAYKFYKELGVKSPFFRAWFGDWREYDDVSRVRTVTVPTIDISQAFLEPGDYKIEDAGWTVHAGKVLNDDTRHHSGGNRINVKSLNAIRDILQNAVLLDTIVSQQDTNKKSANTAFLHKLYTIITYDSKPYIAKITVEEYYNETIKDVSKRAYNLKAIKIEPTGGQLGNDSSSSVPDISSIKSISDLFALVKQYDKEFSPKTSNPLLLDENKQPRVFYHGTNAEFFVFDAIRTSRTTKRYADGFYFTTEKKVAEKWGKVRANEKGGNPIVMACFLDVKNPLIMTAKEYQRLGFDDKYRDSVLQKLIANKNDGIIIYPEEERIPGVFADSYNYDVGDSVYHNAEKYGITDKDYAWWLNRAVENPDFTAIQVAVFSPEQIKSATDNVGTFDSSNPDIRYQKRIETPGASEVLSDLFRDNPNLNGYAEQKQELKSYKELLRSVRVNEQRIAEIDAEIKSLKSKHAQSGKGTRIAELYEMRKRAENRVKEKQNRMFKMEATSLKEVIQKETARLLTERSKEERDLSKKQQKEIRENYARREYIKKIEDRAKGFREALTKNSKDKHIPEPFKAVVADMITALDFSSKRKLEGKEETKKDINLAKAFRKMANVLNLQNVDGSIGEVQNFLMLCDIDESFVKEFTDLAEKINDIADEFGQQSETVLRYMTAEQLRQVNSLLYRLGKQINKVNELIGNNLTRNANDLAIEFINEAEKFTIAKKKNQAIEFLDLKNTTPIYFFKRMGKVGVSIFNEFADGFDRESDLVKQIIDFTEKTYTAKEVKEWSESVHKFTAADGKKLYLTTADMMYFYMLNKRGQGLKHIEGAGVEAEEIKGKAEGDKVKKKYLNDAEGVTISDKIKMDIIGELTPRQIEVADKLQHFMSTTCAAWGNEISMKRFGIKQFLEENYVPIYSSGNTVNKDNSSPATNDTYATLNMSFSQLVDENANNRIMLKNAFDVFADHTTKMAKYNAFAVPLLDIRKFLNYKAKYHTKEDLETDKSFHTKEVLAILDKHYGKEYMAYLDNFIKDIAGEGRPETRVSAFLTKFMSKYKVAAVAANLRVALLQGTSYLRVSSVLDEKYLVKEIKDSPQIRRAMRDMEKYSGIAKWKALGYHDVNVTKSVTDKIKHADTWVDKTIEATMKPVELADKITWASIWLACEEEVKDTQKLQRESDEFYNAVALRFREVIYATQVVDSPLAKSDFMRSKDRLDVVFASFMSEPTLSYNLLLDAYHEIADTKRRGEKIKAKNVKRVGRLVIAYVTSSIAQSVVASLVDALRATGDDEDEEYIDSFVENFLSNIVEELSPLYKLPVIKDILGGFHKGLLKKYYSQPRMDIAVFERVGTAVNSIVRSIAGEYSIIKTVKDVLDAISSATGLPLSNVLRDVKSIWGNVMKWFNS